MTNHTLQKGLFQLSCILIGTAVILGAFGAHGLKNLVSESAIQTFKTGIQYHLIHAFAILILALSLRRFDESVIRKVCYLFIAGILFFSGSLYLLVLTQIQGVEKDGLGAIGMITPLGGLCFIVGWFYLAIKGYRIQL